MHGRHAIRYTRLTRTAVSRLTMNNIRTPAICLAVALLVAEARAQTAVGVCDCLPADGQPAADVLASHDAWGNPTFIGGITNGGPNSGSVW